jgi:hypothetical protein
MNFNPPKLWRTSVACVSNKFAFFGTSSMYVYGNVGCRRPGRSPAMKSYVREFRKKNCDMWSSRSMKAFLAFTVHFLCNDFHRFNYTLAVKPTEGKHTGGMIRQYMQDILNEWCLPEHMMLRGSGSNMVKACQDWGIPHFPCIGHSLHLVVGPFLLQKKEKSTTNATEEANGVEMPDLTACNNDGDDDDATEDGEVNDPYSDEFTDSYNNENALKAVQEIVSK